jgi:FkbM family methyltransferase
VKSRLKRILEAFDERAGTKLHRSQQAGRRVAALIGVTPVGRARIVLAAILLALPRWRRPITVTVRGPEGPLPFTLPDFAGLLVLEEVFYYGDYDERLPFAPRRILDLGANIGVSVLYFKLRYPQAVVEAVEASPRMFALLARNVGGLEGVILRHAAVAAASGPLTFYEGDRSWEGSAQPSHFAGQGTAARVDGVTLDELLSAAACDLVKLDVEGGEFDVLPGSQRLYAVPMVMGEIHATPGTEAAERLLARFSGYAIESTPFDPAWEHDGYDHFTRFTAIRS